MCNIFTLARENQLHRDSSFSFPDEGEVTKSKKHTHRWGPLTLPMLAGTRRGGKRRLGVQRSCWNEDDSMSLAISILVNMFIFLFLDTSTMIFANILF